MQLDCVKHNYTLARPRPSPFCWRAFYDFWKERFHSPNDGSRMIEQCPCAREADATEAIVVGRRALVRVAFKLAERTSFVVQSGRYIKLNLSSTYVSYKPFS